MYKNCTSCGNELPVHHTSFNFKVIALCSILFLFLFSFLVFILEPELPFLLFSKSVSQAPMTGYELQVGLQYICPLLHNLGGPIQRAGVRPAHTCPLLHNLGSPIQRAGVRPARTCPLINSGNKFEGIQSRINLPLVQDMWCLEVILLIEKKKKKSGQGLSSQSISQAEPYLPIWFDQARLITGQVTNG